MATRTRKVSAKLAKARAAHDKFLRSVGVDPSKKPSLSGYVDNPLTASTGKRDTSGVSTSDKIPAGGFRRKENAPCDLPVAQVYHKGPLMVVTDMSTLNGSKRRG